MVLVSLAAQIFITRVWNKQVAFCTYMYIKLYRYPWLPVSPGILLRCRCHQYNLISIDISLPQKSACSSCDV